MIVTKTEIGGKLFSCYGNWDLPDAFQMMLLSGCFALFCFFLYNSFFFLQIAKFLEQLVLIRWPYLYVVLLWVLTFEWVLIAVPRESALHYDYLVSQDLTLKLVFGVGFELFLSPKRRQDIGHVLSVKQMGAPWPLSSRFPIVSSFWRSLHLLWRKARLAYLSALIQHRDNFFPLLMTDYHPNTEKMKEERTVWLHLFEGHLCWIPL